MPVSITILGSGTCFPSINRSSCSVMAKIGKSVIIFDTGAGTIRRILEAGVNFENITHICYSHFHPDHSAELVPILFSTKYSGLQRLCPLTLIGGPGFDQFYQNLKNVYGSWITLDSNMLNFIELGESSKYVSQNNEFSLHVAKTDHNPESIAYRLISSDNSDITGLSEPSSFVYSGDTDYCESLIDLAKNADILICESSLPDHMKVKGHLTPSLAGKIASYANVKKLVLTHFYPAFNDVDIIEQCRKTFTGTVILAQDLMHLVI